MYIEWLFGGWKGNKFEKGWRKGKNNIPQVEVPLSGFYYSMATKFLSVFVRKKALCFMIYKQETINY
jgi:hypothetical protein